MAEKASRAQGSEGSRLMAAMTCTIRCLCVSVRRRVSVVCVRLCACVPACLRACVCAQRWTACLCGRWCEGA